MFRSAPNVAAVMPPSLVEDGEAATVEEGEESAIGRFLWSLVPGISLVGAYRGYQKGSYVSAALNGLFGLADLATVGSLVKVRSGLKLLVGFMKVRVKDAVADEAANQAGVAVAERIGPEAGFVTQIIVSATLSKNVSQQNYAHLGFAAGRRGPKTDPNAPHNARIRLEAEKLRADGSEILSGGGEKERLIRTVGGKKGGRRPDIEYRTPGGEIRAKNIGKRLANGTPVLRELYALDDLNGPGGLPTDFIPYD